jgi:hypothetical protein
MRLDQTPAQHQNHQILAHDTTKLKRVLFVAVSIAINVVLLSIIRLSIHMQWSCLAGLIIYTLFTYWVFRQFRSKPIWSNLLLISIGIFIVHVPQRLLDFESQLVSLPEFACELLGVGGGYLLYHGNKIIKGLTLLATALLGFGAVTQYDAIIDYLIYSDIYRKDIQSIQPQTLAIYDSTQHPVQDTLFRSNRDIVFYVWSTSCTNCISDFPLLDSLAHPQPGFTLYTACILHTPQPISPYQVLSTQQVTFPLYTIRSWADAEARYGIQGVPVTYVIRANRIRYRGSLRGALKLLDRGK